MYIDYGHFKASTQAGDFCFYPTFENMVKIGDPKDIIDVYVTLNGSTPESRYIQSLPYIPHHSVVEMVERDLNIKMMKAAHLVLSACCDKDVTPLIGGIAPAGGKLKMMIGFESNYRNIVELAKHLMFHGIIGESKRESTKKSAKPVTEFHAADFVTMARRHLNVGRDEAWSMTMTELIKEIEATIDEPDNDNGAPTDSEYDNVMEMVKDIERRRLNG